MKRATRMALPPAIASLEQAPFAIALGIAIESADSGVATVRMPFSPNLLNAGGPDVPIHGGAIAALIDIAACAAIWSLPETLRSATVSMTVNYLSPAMTTDLLAHARVRRHGKRLAHLTVEVHDAVGAPIADALVVYKISLVPTLLESIRAAAAPSGLNLVGAIPSSRYDAAVQSALRASRLDPRARSIVVIGNGGGDFWRAFTAYCDTNSGWSERDHPLDDFTREIVAHDLAGPLAERGVTSTIVYPFDRASLNFVELAKLAGLGGPSILGILVHPVFGPWIAFRAALLLDAELDHPGAALGFDPCPTCTARTCIPACPVGAVSFQSGWDIPRCLIHRVEVEPDCAPRCHARAACVLGPEHRYPDDELAYHQRRALESMREYYTKQIKPERADPG